MGLGTIDGTIPRADSDHEPESSESEAYDDAPELSDDEGLWSDSDA